MSHPRPSLFFAQGRNAAGALALACCACASTTGKAPAVASAAPLKLEHQAVVDRLTDEARDFCRVNGQEAKVLQVGTTDLTRDPESRHIVYECVEPPGTDASEADASEAVPSEPEAQ